MAIKLVAIDIDGTLLNEKREVTKEVKEAIAAAVAKGVSIVLCTGRPLPGVQEQLNELNLFQDNDYVLYRQFCFLRQLQASFRVFCPSSKFDPQLFRVTVNTLPRCNNAYFPFQQ